MVAEEEGGTGVSYSLSSKIERNTNTIIISSSYTETRFDYGGENERISESKEAKYTFSLKEKKFKILE